MKDMTLRGEIDRLGASPGQLHYVDLMGLVEIPTQSQKAAGIRMTPLIIVV
ncbi:MAG: hypothetical protein P8179_20745 [Candidatus Thiodiazotropha sp.]